MATEITINLMPANFAALEAQAQALEANPPVGTEITFQNQIRVSCGELIMVFNESSVPSTP